MDRRSTNSTLQVKAISYILVLYRPFNNSYSQVDNKYEQQKLKSAGQSNNIHLGDITTFQNSYFHDIATLEKLAPSGPVT